MDAVYVEVIKIIPQNLKTQFDPMKTFFSMFAVLSTLLLMSCSKEEAPNNNSTQRPDLSDTTPLPVEVINDYKEALIVKVFVNGSSIDRPEGIHTTEQPGKNLVNVVAYSNSEGSIVLTDSQGGMFCQRLEPGKTVQVTFKDVIMNAKRNVIIRYFPGNCSIL